MIFQEFKGTGNTELLSRELFETDLPLHRHREERKPKEEKLIPPALLPRLHMLRRVLCRQEDGRSDDRLLGLLQTYRTNEEMLQSLA